MNSNKLLGVIIDKNLTLKLHIDKTAKSICRNIVLLRVIRKYLSHQTRITFYKSYIQPHIDYWITVCGQSPHVNRIHILLEFENCVAFEADTDMSKSWDTGDPPPSPGYSMAQRPPLLTVLTFHSPFSASVPSQSACSKDVPVIFSFYRFK